mmetsp:Transcript_19168/g.40981  ORF Transcript_19168/g.40981 Transcript_19168/m.40981 type:complete len:106 (-) Transcript_19168:1503-1820(-)
MGRVPANNEHHFTDNICVHIVFGMDDTSASRHFTDGIHLPSHLKALENIAKIRVPHQASIGLVATMSCVVLGMRLSTLGAINPSSANMPIIRLGRNPIPSGFTEQ